MPLTPFSGTLGTSRAAHLLRRAAFGGTRSQIDVLAALTADQAVAELFQAGLPNPAPPIDPATGQEWMTTGTTDANSEGGDLIEFFRRWLVGQMCAAGVTPTQRLSHAMRERITLWMHTHFTTKKEKVGSSRALYFQNALFRYFAFDKDLPEGQNFKALTRKVSVDNAMLIFLDGRQNVKGSVNENYGRELLELYSIGRGLEGTLPASSTPGDYFTFTEQDVRAAAEVLSGFDNDNSYSTLDADTGLPRGVVKGAPAANQHATGNKQFSDYFSGFNGGTITPDPLLENSGQPTEESALDEISQLIEMIYSREETPKHICRKLYRFFVHYNINEALDDTVITDMAATFVANDYKIQPVLEELFASEHFYEAASGVQDDKFGSIIKSPIDLTIDALNFFNYQLPDPQTDYANFYTQTGSLLRAMDEQGLNFYEPFEVAGYSAYHQYPIYNRSWITTNYLTQRYRWIQQTITVPSDMERPTVDVVDFIRNEFADATIADARALIITMLQLVYPRAENLTFDPALDDNSGLTADRMNYFLSTFLSPLSIDTPMPTEADWANRWNGQMDMDVIRAVLENFINTILQTPEYQLF